MNTTAATADPNRPDHTSNRKSMRRRSQLHRPGISLLARGEPMIWLTGSALVLCLLMIVGLLLLILAFGMITFWPDRIIQIELSNGTKYLGEFVRDEKYTVSPEKLATLPPAVAQQLRHVVVGEAPIESRRRLIRTGNFDLTGMHFVWVDDYELAKSSDIYPEWAIVAERTSWGRFYGTPEKMEIFHPLLYAEDEESYREMSDFLAAHESRLSPEKLEAIQQLRRLLDDEVAQLRRDALGPLQDSLAEDPDVELFAQVSTGELIPWPQNAAIAASSNDSARDIQALVEIWTDKPAIWTQFERNHRYVRDLALELRTLEMDELGAANAILEQARMKLRQIELDYHIPIIELATTLKTVETEITQLEQSKNDATTLLAKLESRENLPLPVVETLRELQTLVIGALNEALTDPIARKNQLSMKVAEHAEPVQHGVREYLAVTAVAETQAAEIQTRIDEVRARAERYVLWFKTVPEANKGLPLIDIVRAYPANQLGVKERLAVYLSRWGEFLFDIPREANSEGGVMPAIWGTVAMTVIMSLFVVPFGVLAALYLREYAKPGLLVSAVRISINNLAGVPSIVFGVFGLGFFCYIVGGYIDAGPAVKLPPAHWWLLIAVLSVCSTVSFLVSLPAMSASRLRDPGRTIWRRRVALAIWLVCSLLFFVAIATTPYFRGFHQAELPNPVFAKGGVLWASLTLSLLTLPVVIVATEEALAAVPNSLREGSYACGGSKWQTIRRIILPHAMPGIMTGAILAMARGAGEVAPLMLVGAVKIAPQLPLDSTFPYLHPDRSFMHLGFHIFDLGFQSQNSEAAKPMVFTTTLLLITIVALMNILAIRLRTRLKKRFQLAEF